MTSFEEYCPLCEGGLLASGGLLADGGPLAGGGYACARADSVPEGTRPRTRRVVRIIVCIACSIRGRSPTKLCGFNICSRTNRAHLMPGNALSISLCARSTSDLRKVCSCRSSDESTSSPPIEFEVKRTTEHMILSASNSI